MTITITHTDALESARRARLLAERELRRSELEQERAARALELNLPPVPIDEAGRQRLRVAYADAAAAVETRRREYDRAVEIENATRVLTDALADETQPVADVADGLTQLLELRRRRQREAPLVSGRSRWPSPDARAPLR